MVMPAFSSASTMKLGIKYQNAACGSPGHDSSASMLIVLHDAHSTSIGRWPYCSMTVPRYLAESAPPSQEIVHNSSTWKRSMPTYSSRYMLIKGAPTIEARYQKQE